MSKIALGLLMLALSSLAVDVLAGNEFGNLPLIAAAVFFSCWLVAMVLGRKIKFDPQLR